MEAFGLIMAHLVGDYIFQSDWMAKNKTNPLVGGSLDAYCAAHDCDALTYWNARDAMFRGHLACTVHCLLYTLAVWAFSWQWMPWWGLLACFAMHWPIDRFRLAAWWMKNVSGQAFFASKEHPMFPWSIVVVDNIFHLLTLWGIWAVR